MSAYIVQAVLLALFLSLLFLQGVSYEQLRAYGLEAPLLEFVGAAWQRFGIWVAIAGLLMMLLTKFCQRLFFDAKPLEKRALGGYGIFSFFLYYIVLTRSLQFPLSGDDTYIDYRYVHNWVSGQLNYNPGETVMGMTSHLHMQVLAILSFLTRVSDISVLSQSLNLILQILNYILIYYFGFLLSKSRLWAGIAAAVYSLSAYQIVETYFGKETSLVTTMLLVCLISLEKNWNSLRAWLSALIVLARPEGGIWLLSNLLVSWKKDGVKGLKVWIAPLAFLVCFATVIFLLYGSIIPQGLVGKSKMYPHRPPFSAFFILLRRLGYGTFCPEFTFQIVDPLLASAHLYLALMAGVLVVLAVFKFLDKPVLRFYTLNLMAFWLIYSVSNPVMFDWYHCWFSLIPSFLVAEICTRLLAYLKSKPKTPEFIVASGVCVYLVLVQFSQIVTRPVAGLPAITFYINDAFRRLIVYRDAAEYLNSTAAGKTCAASEIGIFGYYYKTGKILDLVGLVSPQMIKFAKVPESMKVAGCNYAIPPAAISEFKPDFVFTDALFARESIMKDPDFLSHYHQIKFYKFPLWSEGVYLYQRN